MTGEEKPRRGVTRLDVARRAGVSTAVVSYVVNNGPRPVAPATAARVREAIKALGYRPNANARALKLGTTGLLGLLVPDTGNPFYAEYALAIELAATKRELALLIANSGSDLDVEARLLTDLASRQLDGLIIAGAGGPPVSQSMVGRLAATPVVFIDTAQPVARRNTLGPDKHDGAIQAVNHLLDVHGHATVELLMGRGARQITDEREIGWRHALRAAGCLERPVTYAPFTRLGGYRAGQQLLAAEQRPTAVFASSDLLAVGLLRAAHEAGLSVPEDVAVVSFDGTQQTEYCWPPLTTVRQPVAAMAEHAVATILDSSGPPHHRLFPVELVVRRSCGCTETAPATTSRRRPSRTADPTTTTGRNRKRS